ncbi:MAG: hypothetical protein JOZ84_12625 [Methylobacteriaceae bacterium]|nr:hypothetical protein [Methylobacteriaceae bacterium]
MDDTPNLDLLSPDQRARLAAIEASGLSHPGIRLFTETLGLPKSCRLRTCMRLKACVGDKLQCVRDNKELLRSEVLQVEEDGGG